VSLSNKLLPLLVVSLLAGCSTLTDKVSSGFGLFGASKSVEKAALQDFSQSATATLAWRQQVASAGGFVFSPAVVDGSLFAGGQDGQIARFEAGNGKQVWRIDAGNKLSGGVGGDDNLVLAGTVKGDVLAFDHSGKPLWQAKVSSEVLSAPQAAADIVIVRTGDGRIFGLDAKDGKRKWVYQRALPALALRNYAGVTISRGAVLAGFPGGKLVALNSSNGTVGWEATVALPRGATELERIADITSLPVVDNNMVCAAAFQGRVACFDLLNGNQLWVREISSIAGLSMDSRYLYISDAKGAVHALDKNSGASIWKQDKLSGRQLTTPVVLNGYVAVADYQGYVHFLSRDDGGFAARIATDGSAVVAPPLVQNGNLLLQTENGGVFAISVQ
jgi:outer membrane protein assembly factor BamB